MHVNWVRIIRTSLMAGLLAVLAGCSTVRLAYNQAHEAAWWWLTDYVEFSEAQRPLMRQALVQVHAWHRRTQLPAYADMLGRWQPALQGDLPPAQACVLVDELMLRVGEFSGLVDALEPAALQVWASLSPAQLIEMERRMAKSNREFREDYLEPTPQERAAQRLKRTLSRAEMVYGRFDASQKRALEAALARAPWDAAASYERRLRRQQELMQSLRALQGAPAEPVRAALRQMLQRSLEPTEPADRAAMQAARRQSCQLLAEVHQLTTAAQRAKAVETLRRYATDLQALATTPS